MEILYQQMGLVTINTGGTCLMWKALILKEFIKLQVHCENNVGLI